MELQSIVKELREISFPVIDKYNNGNLSFPEDFPAKWTFLHVLERVYCNLESLELLIRNFNQNHEHAIGLIARNLLTDFITTGYTVVSQTEKESLARLYRIYYSDIERAEKYIKLYSNEISKVNLNQITHNVQNNPIIQEVKKQVVKGFPQTSQIIESFLKSKSTDVWTQEIITSYDIWTFYSKYEHLGYYSYSLTRNINPVLVFSRLSKVLRMTTILASSCFEVLNEQEAVNKSKKLLKVLYNPKS